MPTDPSRKTKPERGKGCLTVFFLFFFAMGSLFVVLMLRSLSETAATYHWARTTCEIVSSNGSVDAEASDKYPPFLFSALYWYGWGGREYTASTVALRPSRHSDWRQVRTRMERYPPGSAVTCYVNPSAPSQAILERSSLWAVLLLPLPLVFVLIGAGGIYGIWFWREKKGQGRESISDKARKAGRGWGLVVLFAAFTLIGGGIFLGVFLRPLRQIAESPSWRETECVIEFSRVGRHEGDDSTTYSVDVLYSYEFGGRKYRSSRPRIFNASSSGYAAKRTIVRRLPKGTRTTCYVNPRDPQDAVLDRSFPKLIFLGFIPLAFFLIGAAGLTRVLSKATLRSDTTPVFTVPRLEAGPVVLRPKVGSFGRFVGCAFFTVFWNGVLSVFLWDAIGQWRRGSEPWLETLFLTPFVLVGLGCLAGLAHGFLGLFSPRPVLRMTPGSLSLGGSASVDWEISRGSSAIRRLRIYLEGREEITFRRGKSTVTNRQTFARFDLADVVQPFELSRGTASFTIPRDTMHSFETPSNKIIWALHVQGEMRLWPDIAEELPLNVRPLGTWEGA